MGERTGIEWATATWNPWMGCHKVSPGCKFCYAERDMNRFGREFTTVRRSTTTFRDPLKWAKAGRLAPGSRIFTCSFSDWFIEEADPWRGEAWDVIRRTPKFTYLILTKRSERIAECLPKDWGEGYPNVWLIVSAENQEYYDKRTAHLQHIPAKVRGISAEPLLGPIILGDFYPDWIITGGESGNAPRVSSPEWFRSMRNQALASGIPFFHKQNGGPRKINGSWGGREIDGKTWNEFPGDK